jgi:hypothetical protein
MSKYRVLVYGAGSNQPATKVREYVTFAKAQRYADAQRAKSISAVAERIDAQPSRTNANGSW